MKSVRTRYIVRYVDIHTVTGVLKYLIYQRSSTPSSWQSNDPLTYEKLVEFVLERAHRGATPKNPDRLQTSSQLRRPRKKKMDTSGTGSQKTKLSALEHTISIYTLYGEYYSSTKVQNTRKRVNKKSPLNALPYWAIFHVINWCNLPKSKFPSKCIILWVLTSFYSPYMSSII